MHPQVSIADRYKYWVDTKCTRGCNKFRVSWSFHRTTSSSSSFVVKLLMAELLKWHCQYYYFPSLSPSWNGTVTKSSPYFCGRFNLLYIKLFADYHIRTIMSSCAIETGLRRLAKDGIIDVGLSGNRSSQVAGKDTDTVNESLN